MEKQVIVFFILAGMVISSAGAAEDTRQAGPVVTGQDLNTTGDGIANQSFPSRYAVNPTLIDVRVGVTDTALPGPKGEMAAGPRTIGFAADPALLVILMLVVMCGSAGIWFLAKRRPEDDQDDDDKNDE